MTTKMHINGRVMIVRLAKTLSMLYLSAPLDTLMNFAVLDLSNAVDVGAELQPLRLKRMITIASRNTNKGPSSVQEEVAADLLLAVQQQTPLQVQTA